MRSALPRRRSMADTVSLSFGQQPRSNHEAPRDHDGTCRHRSGEMHARVRPVLRTTANGGDFVPVPERIATFDNDGTLWAEQPMYFQLAFAMDRVKALAPQHPEWKTQQPFKSVLRAT